MRLAAIAVLALLASGAQAGEPRRDPLVQNPDETEAAVQKLEDLLATRLDDAAKRELRERLFPIAERLVPGDEAAKEAYVALLRKRSERISQRIAEVLEARGLKDQAKFTWRDALEAEQAAVDEEIRAQYGTRTSK
jgi:hypothetical protein